MVVGEGSKKTFFSNAHLLYLVEYSALYYINISLNIQRYVISAHLKKNFCESCVTMNNFDFGEILPYGDVCPSFFLFH